VCHPVVAHLIDLVWAKVARRTFFFRNATLMMALVLYTLSQAVFDTTIVAGADGGGSESLASRVVVVACRCFVYLVFLPSHLASHITLGLHEHRIGHVRRFGCIRVPAHVPKHAKCYLLAVLLCLMIALDPVVHCLGHSPLLTQHCEAGEAIEPIYTVPSMIGTLNLYLLASDFSVFNIRIAAFALMFGRVLSEVLLFLLGFAVLLLAFATAGAASKARVHGFETIVECAFTMLDIFMGTAHDEDVEAMAENPKIRVVVTAFFILSTVYLLNLLVAQLASAYNSTFVDIIGFARLKRGGKVVEAMELTSRARWEGFVESLRLDAPMRFCEGDVGMPGALEVMEPADASTTNIESIRRFGGTTSPGDAWPEEESAKLEDTDDRLERIEAVLRKMAKMQGKLRWHGAHASRPSSIMHAGEGASLSSGPTDVSAIAD